MNTTTIKTLAVIALISVSQMASAQKAKTWNIDKSHASVRFGINHFFSEVSGKFKSFDGDIQFSPDNLTNSSVSFKIDVASVDTDEADRDEHLKSADFFNATEYPSITFQSTEFKKIEQSNYKVIGNLTMRGVTKNVELPLKITGRMDNPWKEGYEILGISIDTALNRTDYGIGTGSWAATAVVSDDVAVNISMELDSQK